MTAFTYLRRGASRPGAAAVLAVATGSIALWQSSHIAVLWDLSYILNTAYRISQGDVPYKDFPLPHPPVTFLIQAALIKVFGAHYIVQILYAAAVSAGATALTFIIVCWLLEPYDVHATRLAFLLCIPIAVLGVYNIFPHPFYDPDACFFMLLATVAVITARRRRYPISICVVAGMLLVIPIFVKQNIGIAFFILAELAMATWLIQDDPRSRRGYFAAVVGSLIALGVALIWVQTVVDTRNYLHWTIQYAASRRLSFGMLDLHVYTGRRLLAGLAASIAGLLLLRKARGRIGWGAVGVTLVVTAYVLVAHGLASPATFPSIWPLVMVLASGMTLVRLFASRPTFEILLPLVCVGVTEASFLAQGVTGSTYGIWPFTAIMTAGIVSGLATTVLPSEKRVLSVLIAGLSGFMAVGGAVYVSSEVRLAYANVASGPLERSDFGSLWGMSSRGEYIPQLDGVLRYIDASIPSDQPMIVLPGEDPVYFALQRRPKFPLVTFDRTADPYDSRQLADLASRTGVDWILVKENLQVPYQHVPDYDHLLRLITGGFEVVARPGGYVVYKKGLEPLDQTVARATVSAYRAASRMSCQLRVSPRT